jgi:hypothetical protein
MAATYSNGIRKQIFTPWVLVLSGVLNKRLTNNMALLWTGLTQKTKSFGC